MKALLMKGVEKITTSFEPVEVQELKKHIQNPHTQDELITSLKKLQEQKNITQEQEKETFNFLVEELRECKGQIGDKEKDLFYLFSYWLLHIKDQHKINQFLESIRRRGRDLLNTFIIKHRLEFVRSLLDIIDYFDQRYHCNNLNSFLNSYTRIPNNALITPFMLASRVNSIELVLLLKEYGAMESLYLLKDKMVPVTTAFHFAFCSRYPDHSKNQIRTAFYLWLNGAVMSFKINHYIHSSLSLPLPIYSSESLILITLIWLEFLLTHNQFSNIDEDYQELQRNVWGSAPLRDTTLYQRLSFCLKTIADKNPILYKKGQKILALLKEKGADIDGIIPTKPHKTYRNQEFHFVTLCAAAELKAVEAYIQKEGKKINFFHYVDTPAFIAAIIGSKKLELRDNALKILDLLLNHDITCARYATSKGTMAVTQAALQGDHELLEKLITTYKLPVNPIGAEHNPPVNELLQDLCEQKISKEEFTKQGLKACLGLLIERGSCVEQNVVPYGQPPRPARQYILEQKLFAENDSKDSEIHTNQLINPEELLSYPNLMSSIRANPIQTFIYFSWLSDYMKIDAMQDQNFAKKHDYFVENCIDQGIFSIADLCKLIASYAASSTEEKYQRMSGPGFTLIDNHYAEVMRKKEEEKREQDRQNARP